jgi:hypothetical protein
MSERRNDGPIGAPASPGAAYSGSARGGLCRRLAPAAALLLAAFAAGGCSTSYRLGALGGTDETPTASTAHAVPASFDILADGDLGYAKAAASALFTRGGKDASAAWENPRTGAHGTITPIASAGGNPACREFLASHVLGERESWYQGSACRSGRAWDVRELKALQRT